MISKLSTATTFIRYIFKNIVTTYIKELGHTLYETWCMHYEKLYANG